MVSRSVGQTIIDEVINGEARLQFITDVNNQGTATIHVPCGIIEGRSESLVIFGAHHDTVYNGQGAVDDTSGVATLQEIARQFGLLQSQLGTPEHTLYFCTWGGEEEGLWGSTEWVDKHRVMLEEHLRLYINLDMNHVDAERNTGLTMFGNNKADVDHIVGVVGAFSSAYPELADRYPIEVRKVASTDMPYNSDHAPFVYEIDQDEGADKDYGRAIVCYGSGSTEYHTYLDTMDRFNEESLMIAGIVYGSIARYLAYGESQ
jgi:Zn-dependent M28 family amino/carboxypeptidase